MYIWYIMGNNLSYAKTSINGNFRNLNWRYLPYIWLCKGIYPQNVAYKPVPHSLTRSVTGTAPTFFRIRLESSSIWTRKGRASTPQRCTSVSKMDDLGVPPSHIYIYTYIYIYIYLYTHRYTYVLLLSLLLVVVLLLSLLLYIYGLYMVMGQNPNPDRTLSHTFVFSWSFSWMVIPPVIW